MNPQEMLEQMIDKAWADYVDLHKAEIDSGYDDAMDGFERKEAEGFACGLEAAYSVIFNKEYESKVPEFDPYDYEDNQG
jgi:hypothetical protein